MATIHAAPALYTSYRVIQAYVELLSRGGDEADQSGTTGKSYYMCIYMMLVYYFRLELSI